MPKERKPGFIYMFSEILNQEIAVSNKTGWVYCEDGTKYSPDELKLLHTIGGFLPLEVHILKSQFKGTLDPEMLREYNSKKGLL